jgi:hypothetical protein
VSTDDRLLQQILSDKDLIRAGPPAPPFAPEERRLASISDPAKLSSGGEHFYACLEKDTESFANLFCKNILRWLFRNDTNLNWVMGRQKPPFLRWRNGYNVLSANNAN